MKRLAALLLVALAAGGCALGGEAETTYIREDCTRVDHEGRSVARVWNETLLHAIQRDTPAPTVHARNLFHVSAAMWDAWAAYDGRADGWLVTEKLQAEDVRSAREAALSYAAYRLLLHRYSYASGLQETFDELASTLQGLCYRVDYVETEGDSPAALGNRIAAAYIRRGREDGANEELRYADPAYKPANPPLVVSEPGTQMRDPSSWQPLALARVVAQNGIPQPGSVQSFVGPHWGRVGGFALPSSDRGVPIDPGEPPRADDPAFAREALAVLRRSAELDPSDRVTIDVGPGARGANSLGANDGRGHQANPATGKPYAPNVVLRGDYARALAEYWADGPRSETPPGHWNAVANEVSDSAELERRIEGRGPKLDRLEWDVKLYLALNGAVHDAAVAAWGLKGHYDSARPISIIRYLGARNRLPVKPGLVQRRRGRTFVRAWGGFPEHAEEHASGVRWIPAVRWVPYQLPTFVTPAFAGYVSGHSTFSRAAAEVLTSFTGSSYFPGGLYEVPVPRGALKIEHGPSRDLKLQWATYFDAADAAGTSRLWMGIHVPADDFQGRRVGSQCGRAAWQLALRHFEGAA